MQLTKAQQLMAEDGLPPSTFMTDGQRLKAWAANPPKPVPTSFGKTDKVVDEATKALMAELEEGKKAKTKNRTAKMLDKKVDRTGQRWDGRKGKWVDENAQKEQTMISITTNNRGTVKMKDYAEMSGPELVEAYNKKSGKPPIKKFKDKATGLAAMAKLATKPSAAAASKSLSETVRRPAPAIVKEGSTNKLAAEFGARVGSFREKLIIALDESYRKLVPIAELLKAVYGSKNNENTGALTMVIKGAQTMIEKNKLPYVLKKEKNEGEISFGLWPK